MRVSCFTVIFLTMFLSVSAIADSPKKQRCTLGTISSLFASAKTPPLWSEISRTHNSKTQRLFLKIKNTKTQKIHEVSIPWNLEWNIIDRHVTNTILNRAENTAPIKAAKLPYSREDVLEELVLRSKRVEALDPELPQFLLQEADKTEKVILFRNNAAVKPSPLRIVKSEVKEGVNTLVLDISKLANPAPFGVDDAMDLFLSHLYTELNFSRSLSSAPTIYRLEIMGTSKPFTLHYIHGKNPSYAGFEEKVRNYVLDAYQKNLPLKENTLNELRRINEKMKDRTRMVVITDAKGEIKGAMSIVESKGVSEPLPLEEFSPYVVERNTQNSVVELGRFFVDPEFRVNGSKAIWKVSSLIAGTQNVEKIVAETFAPYAQELVSKRGYRYVKNPLAKKAQAELIRQSKPSVLIEAYPQDILKNIID